MAYITSDGKKLQVMSMTYEVVGDEIRSFQDVRTRIERTRFQISGDLLTLFYDDMVMQFRRLS